MEPFDIQRSTVTLWKGLESFVNILSAQETGRILKIGFTLSKRPNLHRVYLTLYPLKGGNFFPLPYKILSHFFVDDYFCFSNGIVINNKSKLAPIVKSSTAQNLTLTNVGLHNKKDAVHEDKVDLDQTTMIGSALDLDSLESGEDSASLAAPNNGNLLKGIDNKTVGRY